MTIKPRPTTGTQEIWDLARRVQALERLSAGDSGDAGGCASFQPDMFREWPLGMSNWVGYGGDGFDNPMDDFVADDTCWNGGYVHASQTSENDVMWWAGWLGPTGAIFRVDLIAMATAASGQLSLKIEKLTEAAPGLWERDSALLDLGGMFADLYQPSENADLKFDSSPFEIAGANCDTPLTDTTDEVLDGGPGMYRIWMYVSGKNGSSSDFDARIQRAVLRRFNGDEP